MKKLLALLGGLILVSTPIGLMFLKDNNTELKPEIPGEKPEEPGIGPEEPGNPSDPWVPIEPAEKWTIDKLITEIDLGEFASEDFNNNKIFEKVWELNNKNDGFKILEIVKEDFLDSLILRGKTLASSLYDGTVNLTWIVTSDWTTIRKNISTIEFEPVLSDSSHEDGKKYDEIIEMISEKIKVLEPKARIDTDFTVIGNMNGEGIIVVRSIEDSELLTGETSIVVKITLSKAIKKHGGYVIKDTDNNEEELKRVLFEENPGLYDDLEEAKNDLDVIGFERDNSSGDTTFEAKIKSKDRYWNDEVEIFNSHINVIKIDIAELITNVDLGDVKNIKTETLAAAVKLKNPHLSDQTLEDIQNYLREDVLWNTRTTESIVWDMSDLSPKHTGTVDLTFKLLFPEELKENDNLAIDFYGDFKIYPGGEQDIYDKDTLFSLWILQIGYDENGASSTFLDFWKLPNWISPEIKKLQIYLEDSTEKHMDNPEIAEWDTSNVEDMSGLFKGVRFWIEHDIENWDTSNVKNMDEMFMDSIDFNRNLSGWKVGNVTSARDFATGADSWTEPKPNFTFEQIKVLEDYKNMTNNKRKKI
ncbi:BspA family leucine-rich repeat surface protein [[Acholeplasma] multilocale]|uniref:BspA family leucine-rich repeat surface protein n=1 Tax=[Acholeplasma] multilocale TaxID=264638 RepID=UPI00047BA964|nr:BspA family leucine-rich repeat surface protein [[Acholeplasma] multilocale]